MNDGAVGAERLAEPVWHIGGIERRSMWQVCKEPVWYQKRLRR